jgi:hypothetical protein
MIAFRSLDVHPISVALAGIGERLLPRRQGNLRPSR